jgi:hypothetical protein
VRDGNAVSIVGQIAENVFRSTGGSLGIDDTLVEEKLSQEAAEAPGSRKPPRAGRERVAGLFARAASKQP